MNAGRRSLCMHGIPIVCGAFCFLPAALSCLLAPHLSVSIWRILHLLALLRCRLWADAGNCRLEMQLDRNVDHRVSTYVTGLVWILFRVRKRREDEYVAAKEKRTMRNFAHGSELDTVLSRRRTTLEWLDSPGSVYEAGFPFQRKKLRPTSKPSIVM